eukprot:TRINITY_DN234_c0_g1_i1.p1 TRINITY_DN234_c0_g1~~TRINITY_DN234_c0_g1_i1.p1  ORF type:complete len:464 (-),score=64.51 TRINITY_DN234_c0_g1_i1:37-1428(-)
MSEVSPWVNQQSIFITGVTGLLGKVLLLKILMESPSADIYLLIRPKKDMTPQQRFERMLMDSPLFEDHFIDTPELFDRIKVVAGDVGKENLGLSSDDYNEISNTCTCILHLAATVNFDEPLKVAITLNVLGTLEVLTLARNCINLNAIVHVSTAYVNSIRFNLDQIKEKVYPLDFDPYEMIDHIMNSSDEDLAKATNRIIGDHPNTYTFSKAIAEHIIMEEKGDLPLCIVRPSMITCSEEFPMKGWVDSFIGPAGLILAFGIGALHVMRANKHLIPDFIPVDYVAHAILVSAYNTATYNPHKQLPIYHLVSGQYGKLSWKDILVIGKGFFRRNPTKRTMGFPFLFFINNPVQFWILNNLIGVFPSMVKDGQRVIAGKQAKMVAAQKKLQVSIERLQFFTTNAWSFGTKKATNLFESMNETDSKLYNFDIRGLNWEVYMVEMFIGLKMYLLKEAHDKASVAHKL